MNLPIRQRAGHEPRTHFDTTELRLTGIDSPSIAELNRTYQYDKALNTIAANDEIEDLKFVVNGNNQITRVISQHQTRENYYYDQNGYISQQYIHTEDYRYNDGDSRGHIVIDNHDLYQQGNRLNRIGNQHYRYDNAGRLIEKTESQDGFRQKTTYYRWNGNNQLESLTTARGETWYYKYDALGRRTEKACPQQNITTRYLWDGDQVAYQETERHTKLDRMRRHTSSQHYPKHTKAKTRAEAIGISKNGGKEPPAQYWEDELGESATSAQVKAYRNRIEKEGLRNVMR